MSGASESESEWSESKRERPRIERNAGYGAFPRTRPVRSTDPTRRPALASLSTHEDRERRAVWRRAGRRARIFLADEGAAYKRAAFERGGRVERHTSGRWLEWRWSATGRVAVSWRVYCVESIFDRQRANAPVDRKNGKETCFCIRGALRRTLLNLFPRCTAVIPSAPR